MTIPSGYVKYNNRLKAVAHQGNGTQLRNNSFQEASAVSGRISKHKLRKSTSCCMLSFGDLPESAV
jgi:hypothetical protein